MNDVKKFEDYNTYKEELEAELSRSAESFVKIGYLLKVARDTDILKDSPYDNVTDFAKAEYGIDKTQVSRFIHINDRFSAGGYSDELLPQYKGFGYAKLTIMLQLPEELAEELTPNYSKAEIQNLKDEVDEEAKVTDIERLLEVDAGQEQEKSMLAKAVENLGSADPQIYADIYNMLKMPEAGVTPIEDIISILAPSGEKTYSIRIPGVGRVMLILREDKEDIKLVNLRNGTKLAFNWTELIKELLGIMPDAESASKAWEKVYGLRFPEEEKTKVAPVQPEKSKPVKKESKVKKAAPDVIEPKQKKAAGTKILLGEETESKGTDEKNIPDDEQVSLSKTKAMLIMNMPGSCEECPCSNVITKQCQICKKTINTQAVKPNWCPLPEMPKKMAEETRWYDIEYARGYNACICEILKKAIKEER